MKIAAYVLCGSIGLGAFPLQGQKSFEKMQSQWLLASEPKIQAQWDSWWNKYGAKIDGDTLYVQWESQMAFPLWKKLILKLQKNPQLREEALGALAQMSPQRILPFAQGHSGAYEPWFWSAADSLQWQMMDLYGYSGVAKSEQLQWAVGDWGVSAQRLLWLSPKFGPSQLPVTVDLPSCAAPSELIQIKLAKSLKRDLGAIKWELEGAIALDSNLFQLDSLPGLYRLSLNGRELDTLSLSAWEGVRGDTSQWHFWSAYESLGAAPLSCDRHLFLQKQKDLLIRVVRARGDKAEASLLAESLKILAPFGSLKESQMQLQSAWKVHLPALRGLLRSPKTPVNQSALALALLGRMGEWDSTFDDRLGRFYDLREALEPRALGELSLMYMGLKESRKAKVLLDQLERKMPVIKFQKDKQSCQNNELWYLLQSGIKKPRLAECLGLKEEELEQDLKSKHLAGPLQRILF